LELVVDVISEVSSDTAFQFLSQAQKDSKTDEKNGKIVKLLKAKDAIRGTVVHIALQNQQWDTVERLVKELKTPLTIPGPENL
jgi:hypothetical protein